MPFRNPILSRRRRKARASCWRVWRNRFPKTDAVENAETVVKMNRKNPQAAFVGVFTAPPPPLMEQTKSPLFLLSRRQSCRTKAGDLAKLQTRDYERRCGTIGLTQRAIGAV